VETTDSEKRRLDLKPVHSTDVNSDEVTETFWMFNPIEDSTEEPREGPTKKPTVGPTEEKVLGVCSGQHCLGRCKSHCLDHKFTVATKAS
jgi:hypothetical protein